MFLEDTVELMLSADYKDRFKAEYYQLKIRYEKLKNMCDRWDCGALDFTPACSREAYSVQLIAMKKYLDVLTVRADVEGIKL